jgi:hypothetical protein
MVRYGGTRRVCTDRNESAHRVVAEAASDLTVRRVLEGQLTLRAGVWCWQSGCPAIEVGAVARPGCALPHLRGDDSLITTAVSADCSLRYTNGAGLLQQQRPAFPLFFFFFCFPLEVRQSTIWSRAGPAAR